MSAVRRATRRTFGALRVRNFRIYFAGQLISISGTWMQAVAQGWLVLQLTNSGVALGIAIALQFLPMLIAGTWGGLIVDRMSKRKILFFTQGASGVLALVLGILVGIGRIHVWEVFVMAFCLGVVNLFDNPARQSFVQEMVGRELLPNAVSLNSVLMNSGRIIGPAFAGAIIATIAIFLPSFLILVGIAPWFDRVRSSPWFSRAIGGILCSFVGLLLSVTIRFALNIHWDVAHVVLTATAFAALVFKLDILWVILAGTVISAFIF